VGTEGVGRQQTLEHVDDGVPREGEGGEGGREEGVGRVSGGTESQ